MRWWQHWRMCHNNWVCASLDVKVLSAMQFYCDVIDEFPWRLSWSQIWMWDALIVVARRWRDAKFSSDEWKFTILRLLNFLPAGSCADDSQYSLLTYVELLTMKNESDDGIIDGCAIKSVAMRVVKANCLFCQCWRQRGRNSRATSLADGSCDEVGRLLTDEGSRPLKDSPKRCSYLVGQIMMMVAWGRKSQVTLLMERSVHTKLSDDAHGDLRWSGICVLATVGMLIAVRMKKHLTTIILVTSRGLGASSRADFDSACFADDPKLIEGHWSGCRKFWRENSTIWCFSCWSVDVWPIG